MVRALLPFAIALALFLLPQGSEAQKGQQILDLFLQGAQQELYRQEQRDYERQQREERQRQHRQFVALWQACFRDDLAACDQALGYPYLNFNDRQRLIGKRSEIIAARHEAAERVRRDRIQAEFVERRRQRERELQAQQDHERELARQREVAEQERQRVEQAERDRRVAPPQVAAVTQTQSLREDQPVASATMAAWTLLVVVAAIGVVLATFLFRDALLTSMPRLWNLSAQLCSSLVLSGRKEPQSPASGNSASPEDVAGERAPPPTPAAEERPRDTVGAIAALELAHAFIEEIRAADMPGLEDKEARRHHLNTLALASRQLDAAEKLDADAILEGHDEKEVPFRFSVNELKSESLLLEGLTHQVYDLKRAIPALVAATKADPSNARAFYVLGITHAANRNKAAAMTAFRSAVALDPKNIVFRKELNRAESLSAAEIAGYKATRAGERIYDAGIATANAGIMAWNVFAVIWNVVTFPLRILFAIFRILRLHPFA